MFGEPRRRLFQNLVIEAVFRTWFPSVQNVERSKASVTLEQFIRHAENMKKALENPAELLRRKAYLLDHDLSSSATIVHEVWLIASIAKAEADLKKRPRGGQTRRLKNGRRAASEVFAASVYRASVGSRRQAYDQ